MSQPCIADQMVVAAAILVGKGRGIGLDLTHRIVANGRRCESSRENSRQLEARLLRQALAYG
jgi:hypothetical protein